MNKTASISFLALLGGLVLALGPLIPAASAATPRVDTASVKGIRDRFPEPPELRDAVDFWRQVFAVWRRNQVVLHDTENLSIVYDIVELPGPVAEAQTPSQQAYVRARRLSLERGLRELARRVKFRLALNKEQQRLLDVIRRGAGTHVLAGADSRVRSQRGMRERFLEGLKISGRYDRIMRDIFRDAALPEDLALLPHIESSFVNNARSSAGAAGIWQFMPATGRRFLRINNAVDERFDPILAAHGAARYLRNAYDDLGDWALAITSYNHGVGGMVRAQRQFGNDFGRIVRRYRGKTFGFSSRNFYAEFLAVRSILDAERRYFPEGVRYQRPLEHHRIRLKQALPLTRLAASVGVHREHLLDLNPAWTRRAARGLVSLPVGSTVWLPSGTQVASVRTYAESVSPAGRAFIRPSGEFLRAGLVYDPMEFSSSTTETMPRRKRSKERTHIVRKGESPYLVASRYDVPLKDLLALNDIGRRGIIRPGQRLRIPAR
ncbi:MAG: transglycosylase SLT domain-containing protein [Gammaproteobacteria bacterium]